jgi:hypothetical protein
MIFFLAIYADCTAWEVSGNQTSVGDVDKLDGPEHLDKHYRRGRSGHLQRSRCVTGINNSLALLVMVATSAADLKAATQPAAD